MPLWFPEENVPITLKEVGNGAGIIFDCEGVVTGQDMLQASKQLLSSEEKLKEWLFGLIDHTNVTSADYTTADLRALAELDKTISPIARKGAVIAIVAPSDVQYGLSRMWQALVEGTVWETMVCRSREDAQSWIKRKVKDNFGIDLIIAT